MRTIWHFRTVPTDDYFTTSWWTEVITDKEYAIREIKAQRFF